MNSLLCIRIEFLQPYSHSRDENGDPEWPPSPLRVLQALVAASAGRWNERRNLNYPVCCLRKLESLPPPEIVAAESVPCTVGYRLYVPDNVTDKVAATWSRRRDASISDYRAEKDVRPAHLAGTSVHYLYQIPDGDSAWHELINVLKQTARSMTHVGWGIDVAVGDASLINAQQAVDLSGLRWQPSTSGGVPLRVPTVGTLDDVVRKHDDFLNRITTKGFHPVRPLRVFNVVRYRRENEPLGRPYRAFELRDSSGEWFRYPHRKLIHIAGMMRHLATEMMKKDPPSGVDENWVKSYVAGHAQGEATDHRQLSYLPLPSVGHEHTDPGVRRVMVAAPLGDDTWLDHVSRRLAGQMLKPDPEHADPFTGREPPILVPISRQTRDNVVSAYTRPASVWHSFTPIILPGHDDQKLQKTRALIGRALRQSGIEQPCEFEWSAFSRFPKSYAAHKYDRNKRPQGYFRPNYLNSLTTVHLTLRFRDKVKVPGPLAIGAGRHCGLGLMAHMA
jgi:CRISPR-associated protein Csb2